MNNEPEQEVQQQQQQPAVVEQLSRQNDDDKRPDDEAEEEEHLQPMKNSETPSNRVTSMWFLLGVLLVVSAASTVFLVACLSHPYNTAAVPVGITVAVSTTLTIFMAVMYSAKHELLHEYMSRCGCSELPEKSTESDQQQGLLGNQPQLPGEEVGGPDDSRENNRPSAEEQEQEQAMDAVESALGDRPPVVGLMPSDPPSSSDCSDPVAHSELEPTDHPEGESVGEQEAGAPSEEKQEWHSGP